MFVNAKLTQKSILKNNRFCAMIAYKLSFVKRTAILFFEIRTFKQKRRKMQIIVYKKRIHSTTKATDLSEP